MSVVFYSSFFLSLSLFLPFFLYDCGDICKHSVLAFLLFALKSSDFHTTTQNWGVSFLAAAAAVSATNAATFTGFVLAAAASKQLHCLILYALVAQLLHCFLVCKARTHLQAHSLGNSMLSMASSRRAKGPSRQFA